MAFVSVQFWNQDNIYHLGCELGTIPVDIGHNEDIENISAFWMWMFFCSFKASFVSCDVLKLLYFASGFNRGIEFVPAI